MDNNELDKILKEKLKNQITPSKEFEQKIQNTIKEQKVKVQEEANKQKTVNSNKYNRMKLIISIAAVALIALMIGISFRDEINFEEKTITIAAIKEIKPTKTSNEVLASDSEFLIYTQGEDVTVESVQKSLYIEPALEYTINKTNNENEYKLTFKQNIPNNTIVKLQYVKDKITQDSWAYQTSTELSVNGTYPYNDENYVSKNTVIEIEFSYASIEKIEEHVEISPATKGTWEHLGKVWRFTPEKELSEDKYTVTVKKGIASEQKTLKDDYTFSFSVGEASNTEYYYNTISIDGINNYKPDEVVRIYCSGSWDNKEKLNISKIEIAKFASKEDFTQYLQDENYDKATNLGEYEFEQTSTYVQFTNKLQTGYYAAVIYGTNGVEIFNCPIQINELSAYAIETERDVLVWVANGENLAKDIQVTYQGKIEKTDSKGLAEFTDIADDSEKIKYLEIGNTSNKLVVGIYNYDTDNYPNAYLYTDRPLYKNTDTINIWGFVPRNLFYDEIEEEFYIELNSEGKQKVNVDEDGNINYSIQLKNHMDDEYALLTLYYKDTIVAVRAITIENYEAQNYTYEVIYDKNYAYAGTKFEFDVKITHITGLTVPNKTVCAEYKDEVYRVKSGKDGIAHFSIEISGTEYLSSAPHCENLSIYNGDTEEYTNNITDINIYEINKDVYTVIEKNNNNYVATLHKLTDNKGVMVDYSLEDLYDGVYNTSVNIKLEESVWTRFIDGYTYNEYTKENEPEYVYRQTETNTIDIKTVETANGKVEVNTSELPLKEDTDEVNYDYDLIFTYKDQKGRTIKDTQFIYNEEYDQYYTTGLGYYYSGGGWDGEISDDLLENIDANYNLTTDSYYTYRYFLKGEVNKFSIGDTVNFTLAESTDAGVKDISNAGKILRIVFQEDITQKEIIENDNFDYKFTKEDFPGCKITTAYFHNGKFYRMPIYYFDFNEEDRNIDIEITADKEQYSPGDEVTLTVKTTNNGKAIKTFVNISVANEAVFALEEDTTNLVEEIYWNKNYPVYTYSTYRDYIDHIGNGGGGGGGDPRANFGDTAYFETIYTNSNGVAIVTFKLPDNVTTYRVTAHSANEDLYLGVNTIDIVSTLDFFIQFTEPRNVKTSDDLVLNATSIADKKYNVEYEFTIKELNKTLTTTGTTNSISTVNFGKLPYGTYTARITGKYENYTDTVEYKFDIIESAQEVKTKTTVDISNGVTIKPTKNPIVLEIYNKNINQYLQYIDFIESTVTTRLDTQIAYNKVQEIKDKYYGTTTTGNIINIEQYETYGGLKNLPSGGRDTILTALISYYTDGYYEDEAIFSEMDNLFERYLLAAANNEPVLLDLLYLKEEKEISNYGKLLVTLSLEFVGDFQNAKELYNTIELTNEETKEYKSIVAIIETFINKESAVTKINELIEKNPSNEYLRFSILSFFQNNSTEIEEESEVTITTDNSIENIKLNGMQVKTLTINNEDLSKIKFETASKELMISYYYQTSLDNVEEENISKDIKISIDGKLKKENEVTLVVELPSNLEGSVRIALPNSLRLAQNYNNYDFEEQKYYLQNNQIDYVTFFKPKGCTKMEIPLMVTYEGNYKFENIVCNENGTYHISNSIDLNIGE